MKDKFNCSLKKINNLKGSHSSKSKITNILVPLAVASVIASASCNEKEVSSSIDTTKVQVNYPKDSVPLSSVTDFLDKGANFTLTVNESLNLGKEARIIVEKTRAELNKNGTDLTPGMADLREIRIDILDKKLRDLDGDQEYIEINGYKYLITDKNQGFSDGNYYNRDNDTFYIVTDNGNKILEYSDFWGFSKIKFNNIDVTCGKDDVVDGFIGQFGKIVSEETRMDSDIDITTYYNYEYDKMLGHYDFGVGTMDGEVKNIHGDMSSFGFRGAGIFNLNNGVILQGDFSFDFNDYGVEILGTGSIVYANKKIEKGIWNENIYNKLFEE